MNRIGFFHLLKRETLRFLSVAHTTLFPPIVSAALFIIVFGIALGGGFHPTGVESYSAFILPGMLIMNLVTPALHNSAFSVFEARWHGHIKERLAAPLSHLELLSSVLIASIVRGFLIVGILTVVFVPLIQMRVAYPLLMILMTFLTATAFGAIGIIVGLWASDWDQLFIFEPFILLPLTFLGGAFYSIEILPVFWQNASKLNPLLYIVNTFRWTMTGVSDTSPFAGFVLVTGIAIGAFLLAYHLYRKGWRLRE